jgi:hypothetical protein
MSPFVCRCMHYIALLCLIVRRCRNKEISRQPRVDASFNLYHQLCTPLTIHQAFIGSACLNLLYHLQQYDQSASVIDSSK